MFCKHNSLITATLITIFLTIVAGCKTGKKVTLNNGVLQQIDLPSQSIFVSCIRCSCISDYLRSSAARAEIGDIAVYCDTTCSSGFLQKNIIHINQSLLDSIYEKNYNMILIRKNDRSKDTYAKLLRTEDNFSQEIKKFFQ